MEESSLGMLELNSVATGIAALDAMLKKSAINLIDAFPVCPGKYIILISGEVGAVTDSVHAGREVGREQVIDSFIIPYIDREVITAIGGTTEVTTLEAVAVIEFFSVASTILAADAAVKAAAIKLIEVRLAKGLGGKSFFSMTGPLSDIRSAEKSARETVTEDGLLFSSVIIPAPHPLMNRALL